MTLYGILGCDMSNALKEAFRPKGSIGRLARPMISFMPISIMVPPSAMHRHDSVRRSPVIELKIISQPRLPVSFIRSLEKPVVLEDNM